MVSGFLFAYGSFIAFWATRCSPLSGELLVPYNCLAAGLTVSTLTTLVKPLLLSILSRPKSRFQWFQVVLRRCDRGWHTRKTRQTMLMIVCLFFNGVRLYWLGQHAKPFPGESHLFLAALQKMMVGEMFRQTSCYWMPRWFSAAVYLAALALCSAYVRAKLCVPLKSSLAHMYR